MAEERSHKKHKTDHAGAGDASKRKSNGDHSKGKGKGKAAEADSLARGPRGGRGGGERGHGRGRGSGRGRGRGGTSSSSRGGGGRGSHRRGSTAPAHQSQAEPGVNKLKASIRQVKRLLAKPNLAPDVQQEAERRLKALEEDVQDRLEGSVRRAWEERWKKVRFFERQKVMRKIKQLSKRLTKAEADGSQAAELQVRLTEAREWLNYIIHFPITEPYLPLFASGFPSPFSSSTSKKGTRKGAASSSDSSDEDADAAAAAAADSKSKAPAKPATSEQLARRLAVRDTMRAEMLSGAMSRQPEVDLEAAMREGTVNALGAGTKRKRDASSTKGAGAKREDAEDGEDEEDDGGLKGDAFFEGGDVSDENSEAEDD